MSTPTRNVPRSHSVPHFASLRYTTTTKFATSTTESPDRHARPHLPRHRSALALSGTHLVPKSIYTPRVERDDPFSLTGFFPTGFADSPSSEQQWDWLRADDLGDEEDAEDTESDYPSGRVSPISESDDEWMIHTPRTLDTDDSRTGDAIKREDKLGILALSDTLFLPPHGDELYVEDRLLSPYMQPGDPLEADAVYDTLRALRTAQTLRHGSGAKYESAALHGLFSPENETEDKTQVEADGLGALVSWGVSRVVDYLSPV